MSDILQLLANLIDSCVLSVNFDGTAEAECRQKHEELRPDHLELAISLFMHFLNLKLKLGLLLSSGFALLFEQLPQLLVQVGETVALLRLVLE